MISANSKKGRIYPVDILADITIGTKTVPSIAIPGTPVLEMPEATALIPNTKKNGKEYSIVQPHCYYHAKNLDTVPLMPSKYQEGASLLILLPKFANDNATQGMVRPREGMMRQIFHHNAVNQLLLLFCLFMAGGCATPQRPVLADAPESGFSRIHLEGNPYTFAGQIKMPASSAEALVVYIEGDGHVVDASGRISTDPTPHFPVGWLLARQDPAPAVLYLARLGQYNAAFARVEYRQYWTEKRFAPEIIQAMSLAIDAARQKTGATKLHLVGFSGGGAVAALLAAQRNDVVSLMTVAGLMDHAWWTNEKGYPPLTGSLNPANVAGKLAHLPQIHFYGTNDSLIPQAVSSRFLGLAPFSNASQAGVAASHNKGWEQAWPVLLQTKVIPLRSNY